MSIRECLADILNSFDSLEFPTPLTVDQFLEHYLSIGKQVDTANLGESELDLGQWETSIKPLIREMCLHHVHKLLEHFNFQSFPVCSHILPQK